MGRSVKEALLPGEAELAELKLSGLDPAEVTLTDRRVLVAGSTAALGGHFSLVRGKMLAAFPLTEYQSYVIGVGQRPLLLLSAIALAVAGGFLFGFDATRRWSFYGFGAAIVVFLLWTALRKTFLEISAHGLKIVGRVNRREALLFAELLQLAAIAAKAGAGPDEVRRATKLAGKPQGKPTVAKEKETS